MVVVPRNRSGINAGYTPIVDPDWDDDGVDTVLAACRYAIDRHGVINLHPDGYDSAQLQSPLICDPGDISRPWRPLLPQLDGRYNFDWGPTRGHWAERRCERDRRKLLPPQERPLPAPEPKPLDARGYHPRRPRPWEAEWGEPPPPPPLTFSELLARAEAQQKAWRVMPPPPDWPQPTVTFAPGPAQARARAGSPSEPEEPPLPAIEAPTLESALREFYRLYEGQGVSARTKALYRSTVLKFLPGYQFPAHLR